MAQSGRNTHHRRPPDLRVPPIQRPNTNGERDVKRLLTRRKLEVFNCHYAKAQAACGNFCCRSCEGLRNRPLRAVDSKYVASSNTPGNRPSCRARAAADFQNTHARFQRQRIHDCGKAR